MLGVEPPGSSNDFIFEPYVQRASGKGGFADVWKKGFFGWEYKAKGEDLTKAYSQLLDYADNLLNPPVLVVCDMNRFVVRTHYTGHPVQLYDFDLNDLRNDKITLRCPRLTPLAVLQAVFIAPQLLQPELVAPEVTKEAARRFAELADSLNKPFSPGGLPRNYDRAVVARYLMRVLFCLFAEDTALLPDQLFTRILRGSTASIDLYNRKVANLFHFMAQPGESVSGTDMIAYFNGGLFTSEVLPIELEQPEIAILTVAARLDWANIDPTIFGTLFEGSLDPRKRKQLGAHYTSREDIMLIVEPVVLRPLHREWHQTRREAAAFLDQRDAASSTPLRNASQNKADELIVRFLRRLAEVTVLDPACGSGNFLYVALRALLDLEREVRLFAEERRVVLMLRQVSPHQLRGIEKDSFAHELASLVVWIGFIQWLRDNGYQPNDNPVLENLGDNIRHADAILAYAADGQPYEPTWPAADFIIGNPPFLGNKMLRTDLGNKYVEDLYELYRNRVPNGVDLVCYWFERARVQILTKATNRAGLLATQGIRGGANRKVLENIKQTGDIFMAWADRAWTLDGANVHVSMVGFDNGSEQDRTLDALPVATINANLTASTDLTLAQRLRENVGIGFMGDIKVGGFDLHPHIAQVMLKAADNPNGRSNADVIRPWFNGIDLTTRPRNMWIIDFGVDMPEAEAAMYVQPFAHIEQYVKPIRVGNSMKRREKFWWIHGDAAPRVRNALAHLQRYIATPTVSKHRLFMWLESSVLPDHQLIVFAREDDYFFGVLHAKLHELWARGMGTQLREVESGFRYTPTTTFETYPFPWPPGREPQDTPLVQAIAEAARDLVRQRDEWLHAPGLEAAALKTRTLTALYNNKAKAGFEWLAAAHARLDRAVLAAYGWPADLSDSEILSHLLALNLARAAAQGTGK